MRTKTLALAVLCLAGCLPTSSRQAAAPKPDFSGSWTFDPERSSLQMAAPDASTFVIEHREPHWRVTRTHVYGDRSDTLTLELTTDGETVTETLRGWEVDSRMHWDDGTLVFESTMSRGSQATVVVVRYRLEDGGRKFIAEEHVESGQEIHDNLWVFGRSTP